MDGIINVFKPGGMTSHDVVQKVRWILKEKRIGHTGTLDPLATGVLVLCVGKATRIARFIEAGEKEYQAVMRLGITTDTLDADGAVVDQQAYVPPAEAKILEVMQAFTGSLLQQPPVYSALKVGGVPSYQLARQGKAEPLSPRTVQIFSIELMEYSDPLVSVSVRCSKGVYIRSLCADIGSALGMGAHIVKLERTRSGRFGLAQSWTLDALSALAARKCADEALIPMDTALADFPVVPLEEPDARRISHGNQISCPASLANTTIDRVRLHDPAGKLLALARVMAGVLKPETVFSS